jgi:hypothetical protein
MEPSVLGLAIVEGGPDRKIKLDRSPGIDEVTACSFILSHFLLYEQMLNEKATEFS